MEWILACTLPLFVLTYSIEFWPIRYGWGLWRNRPKDIEKGKKKNQKDLKNGLSLIKIEKTEHMSFEDYRSKGFILPPQWAEGGMSDYGGDVGDYKKQYEKVRSGDDVLKKSTFLGGKPTLKLMLPRPSGFAERTGKPSGYQIRV
jgi:hypothetical protein